MRFTHQLNIFGNLKKNCISAKSVKVLTKISRYYSIPNCMRLVMSLL